jgi:hypothetical protein
MSRQRLLAGKRQIFHRPHANRSGGACLRPDQPSSPRPAIQIFVDECRELLPKCVVDGNLDLQ